MIRTIFKRTDIFLLFIIFLTFLSSLIMTMCKSIKKGNSNLRISHDSFNSIHRRILYQTLILSLSSQIYTTTFPKLLTKHHQISLHRQLPRKTQQFLQLPRTPKHPHEFHFKITHTLLNDTPAYLNL